IMTYKDLKSGSVFRFVNDVASTPYIKAGRRVVNLASGLEIEDHQVKIADEEVQLGTFRLSFE
ncbi:MAG: hypothetical protein ACR2QF_13935, partial [Geminicoccaceae bacterium]